MLKVQGMDAHWSGSVTNGVEIMDMCGEGVQGFSGAHADAIGEDNLEQK